jgi:outer membrane receptor protein involved in Fe transport
MPASRYALASATAFLWIATLASLNPVAAQQPTGRIVGRVIEARSGRPLGHAAIQLVGTTRGVSTTEDGRFTLGEIPAGTVTLHIRLLGYQPKTVTGILLRPDGVVEQNISLEETVTELAATVVTATVERGATNALLDEQRNSTEIVNAIGSEQMSKSPDGDAAQAIRRVSGVTIQDDKYVHVRGLGERYTTVSLNGSRMASPDPERRAVPLDLFPATLIQSISTRKTFSPDQPGDFSGARVDIRTREFPAKRVLTYSMSIGMNAAATGRSVLAAPGASLDWLALGGADRRLPGSGGMGQLPPGLSGSAGDQLMRALGQSWMPFENTGAADYGLTVSLGGDDEPFGHRVGYIVSLTYSRKQEVRHDQIRSMAVPASSEPGHLRPYNSFGGSTGRTAVLWGGILNLSTWIGRSTKLSLDNSYDRNADNEAYRDEGIYNDEIFIQRSGLRYTEHSVRSNQLRVEHSLSERQKLDVSLTNSAVTRLEPDRADITYGREYDPALGDTLPLALLAGTPDANKRTSSELRESVWDGQADYAMDLGSPGRSPLLKIGGALRATNRTANQSAFDVLVFGLTQEQREASPGQIFDGRYASDTANHVVLSPNQGGGYYKVNERIPAGYAMLEVPIGERLRLTGGARVEWWNLDLRAEGLLVDSVTVKRATTDLLPALSLTYKLTDNQNLRLAASQTISRPEYREMAPISYRGGYGDQVVFGNSTLGRALIQNYDIRWEWFPDRNEVVSVGTFAKRFHDPIERIDVATSGAQQLSYTNAAGATNYGVELELRTGLGRIAPWLAPLALTANATLMTSEIDLGNEQRSSLQSAKRAMVGQAPYVLNTGVSYTSHEGATSATLLYNIVGKRIYAAGVTPRPDSYELPRATLDFALRFPLPMELSGKLDAKNLLDSPYRVTQGGVTRERYTTGRIFTLGLSWQR